MHADCGERGGPLALDPSYRGLLPTLPGFLPAAGLRPNSERYIVGPSTLAKFYPGISPSLAAFHLSAEAETATFGKDGGIQLAIFSYPTFEIARSRLPLAYHSLPGTLANNRFKPSEISGCEMIASRTAV